MRVIFAVFFAVLSLLSLLKLEALRTYDKAKGMLQQTDLSNKPNEIYSLELAKSINSASSSLLAGNESRKLEINYLTSLARRIPDTADKIKAYCAAFKGVNKQLERTPFDSRLIISWLDLQQIVETSECGVNLSKDKKNEMIDFAIKQDPTNTEILFASAFLHVWSNNWQAALPIFSKVLKLSTQISPGSEDLIINLIETPEEFASIVPASFPQILKWVDLLSRKNKELYSEAIPKIADMQLTAIQKGNEDVAAGKLPTKIHLEHLLLLQEAAVNDSVRKADDLNIASIVGEKSALGNYLKARAKLNRVSVNKAFKTYDTQPYKGSFTNWGTPERTYLDAYNSSIGIYKGQSKVIKTVELVSAKRAQPLPPEAIKVYVSEDNNKWLEVPVKFELISNSNIDQSYLTFAIKDSNFKYLKVNYSSSLKNASFWNYGPLIVNVYG